jgi:hypothetical protein
MPRFQITQVTDRAPFSPLQPQRQLPDTGAGAVTDAFKNIGDQMITVGEKMLIEDLDRSVSILGVRALKDLNTLKTNLRSNPDHQNHDTIYGAGVAELREAYQSSVGKAVWKSFEPQFVRLAASTGIKVQKYAWDRGIDQSKADLNTGLDELARQYGAAENDLDRKMIGSMALELIEGRARNNVITQVEAGNLERKFGSDIVETQVRQDLFVNPALAESKLLQGKYENLTPEKTVIWLERAPAKIEANLAKNTRLPEREERLAARSLTQRRNAPAKDGYQLLATGDLTMQWINDNEANLPKADFKTLLDKLTGGDTVTDDVNVVADLYTRLANEDVGANAIAAYRRGSIRRETMGALLGRNDALLNGTGPKSPYRRGMAHIKTSLGVNEFQNIPGQRRRLADAVLDFDAWIDTNKGADDKQILETSRRLVREYSIADWNRLTISLPFPAYFAGTRVKPDIAKSKAALVQQFQTKHKGDREALIADPDYQRGVRIIRQWEDAIKLRENGSGANNQ